VATCAFHSIWVKNLLRGIPGAIDRSWAIKIVVILAVITGVALFIEEMWRLLQLEVLILAKLSEFLV
jgi:hypothetical protein